MKANTSAHSTQMDVRQISASKYSKIIPLFPPFSHYICAVAIVFDDTPLACPAIAPILSNLGQYAGSSRRLPTAICREFYFIFTKLHALNSNIQAK
jgi:hypothetical protein